MHNVPSDLIQACRTLEGRMVTAGIEMTAALERAGVTRESWRRWKAGEMPQMRKWLAVNSAVNQLLGQSDAGTAA